MGNSFAAMVRTKTRSSPDKVRLQYLLARVGSIWRQARLGQFITPTVRFENQNKIQYRPIQATAPSSSH